MVSTDQLIDELWDNDPPMTARTALQVYVSNLRKLFKKELGATRGEDLLVSHGHGYCLTAAKDEIDIGMFENLVRTGEQRAAESDLRSARDHYERALDLWTGECLADLPCFALRGIHAVHYQEQREHLLVERIRIDLALGRHAQVIPELQALTIQHPTREGLAELLMRALHRSGRRADALAVYHRIREALVEQLGVDPSSTLTEVYTELLDADTAPRAPIVPAPAEAEPPPPAELVDGGPNRAPSHPAQLPRRRADLRGRRAEIALLNERLSSSRGERTEVCVLAGEPGVGKTEVALHVAHDVRDLFPDGQIHVSALDEAGRPVGAGALAQRILRSLGEEEGESCPEVCRIGSVIRSALFRRRVLLVIEDVEAESQVRSLIPGYEGCAVIITSRSSLLGLPGVTRIRLGPLRAREGAEYFRALWEGETPSDESVRELVDFCDGLPLALRICALRGNERFSRVEDVLAELRSSARPLNRFRAGDIDLRESLAWTVSRCDLEQSLLLAQVMELGEGYFLVDDFLRRVPLGITRAEATSALASLVERAILDRDGFGKDDRYRMRNLVREYLREQDQAERVTVPSN